MANVVKVLARPWNHLRDRRKSEVSSFRHLLENRVVGIDCTFGLTDVAPKMTHHGFLFLDREIELSIGGWYSQREL